MRHQFYKHYTEVVSSCLKTMSRKSLHAITGQWSFTLYPVHHSIYMTLFEPFSPFLK